MNWQAGARLRIPEATGEMLCLAYVDARRSPRRLWFLTERGADWVDDAGDVDRRPKVLTPEQAAGPLRSHTLGVNEVGISFLQTARERGDEFGPLSWRHEVSHPLNRGRGRARQKLIADAVFTYARVEDRSIFIEQRFVEVDRATLSVERLVAELARYGQLERAREKSGALVHTSLEPGVYAIELGADDTRPYEPRFATRYLIQVARAAVLLHSQREDRPILFPANRIWEERSVLKNHVDAIGPGLLDIPPRDSEPIRDLMAQMHDRARRKAERAKQT